MGGRVAQLDRALASGARGRGFESRSAHQVITRDGEIFSVPFFFLNVSCSPHYSAQVGQPPPDREG